MAEAGAALSEEKPLTEDETEKLKKKIELGERETSRYESLAGATEYIVSLLREREDEIFGHVKSKTASHKEILEYERVRLARDAVTGEWSQIKIDAEAWRDEVKTLRSELAGEGEDGPHDMCDEDK